MLTPACRIPPSAITDDPSADTLTFTREFKLELNAIVSFFLKLFGAGNAKAELSAKRIRSATIQMGALSHCTIQTGELIDYLLKQNPNTSCGRDIYDKDHFTIIAALRAGSFTYSFRNESGAAVKFTGPEANALFQAEAGINVSVTDEGKVVVNSPSYVGVITWDGKRILKEIEKARKFKAGVSLRAYKAPTAIENACLPKELRERQLRSLKGARTGISPKRKVLK